MPEIIKNIDINSLVPFENHPFKERSGMEQEELFESIKENETEMIPFSNIFNE